MTKGHVHTYLSHERKSSAGGWDRVRKSFLGGVVIDRRQLLECGRKISTSKQTGNLRSGTVVI